MGSKTPNPVENCPMTLPLALLLTALMMIVHPVRTWRIIRDGE